MGYELEDNVRRLERIVIDLSRAVDRLTRDLLKVAQDQRAGGSPGGYDPSAGGGGLYWATGSPISAGGSAEMDVFEIGATGSDELGERTVVNPWPDATGTGTRLFLIRCRNGQFAVVNETCDPI